MAKEYKVTMWNKGKKKIKLTAVYVTTESMTQAKRIAKLNHPELDVLDVRSSGR